MIRGVRVFAALVVAVTVSAGVSACGKKKPAPPPPAPAPAPAPPPTATPPPPPPPAPPPAPRETPRTPTEEETFASKSLTDLNNDKPLSDAFFALDSYAVTEEGKAALQKNADWMKRWTSTKILIEGHCDSRGTPEYNLALGERRATAVRTYLANLGIAADRLQIVSKGKEAPFCQEENESCWQENRRGHFVITAK